MNIKEKIKELSFPNMKKGIERFPITVLFGVVLFVITSIMTEQINIFEERELMIEMLKWNILFLVGLPIVTTLEIIREKYFFKINKVKFRILYLLLSGCFLYLCRQLYLNGTKVEEIIGAMKIQAIGVIGYLSFLLVPLIERKYDKEKYLQSVLGNKIITIFFSMVFYL